MTGERRPPGLLADLLRGKDAEHVGTPPHSHFESPPNLAATESLRFEPKRNELAKIFLGAVDGAVTTQREPDGRVSRYTVGGTLLGYLGDQHMTVIAGARSGKSRSFLVPVLLTMPSSAPLFVLDPKGELSKLTAHFRRFTLGQETWLFDPYEICGDRLAPLRVRFNVIDILMKSDPRLLVVNAKLIADALIVSTEYQDTRHWDDTAKQILAALCLHVATAGKFEGYRDLVTVFRLACELASLDPSDGRYWLEKELIANDALGGAIKLAARVFYDRVGGEFSSVTSNLRRHIEWVATDCICKYLVGNSIQLRDLIRKSATLYISIPAMQTPQMGGLMRLAVQMTLAGMEEEFHSAGRVQRRLFMLLDEFHLLGRMPLMATSAALFANMATMVVVLQDLGQIQSLYPKSWETFIGNSGALLSFGLNDLTTQKYLSEKLGTTPTLSRSTNMPGYDQATRHASTGESWSVGSSPLLSAEEIGRIFARDDGMLRQLLLRPGYHPAILMRTFYDKHEAFRGRYALDE